MRDSFFCIVLGSTILNCPLHSLAKRIQKIVKEDTVRIQ